MLSPRRDNLPAFAHREVILLQEKLTAFNSFVVRSKFDNSKIALFFHVIRDDFKPFFYINN